MNKYNVTFVNFDGTVLQTGVFEYDSIPGYKGGVPKRPADEKSSYAFNGWSPEIKAVTGDATYTAQFMEVPLPAQKASLTFDFDGGTLDGKTSVTIVAEVGDVITIPNAPTKDGYEFKYWKGSEYHPGDKYTVEGDHAFTAVWEQKSASSPSDGSSASKPTKANSPSANTGDTIPIEVLGILAALSILALAAALVARSREL